MKKLANLSGLWSMMDCFCQPHFITHELWRLPLLVFPLLRIWHRYIPWKWCCLPLHKSNLRIDKHLIGRLAEGMVVMQYGVWCIICWCSWFPSCCFFMNPFHQSPSAWSWYTEQSSKAASLTWQRNLSIFPDIHGIGRNGCISSSTSAECNQIPKPTIQSSGVMSVSHWVQEKSRSTLDTVASCWKWGGNFLISAEYCTSTSNDKERTNEIPMLSK